MRVVVLLIFVFIVISGYFYFFRNEGSFIDNTKETTASFTDMGQPLSEDIINCEFKVISSFVYQNKKETLSDKNRKINYITTDEKPNLITFAGLSSKEPKLKGNMGDSPLTEIKNDNETIVLIEKNGIGDIFVYTIFKKEKVATWYKSYKMLIAPFGMLSMGYCY